MKKQFNGNVNIEDITELYYEHREKFRREFEVKDLKKYHDLHAQSDTFLLVGVLENI